MRDIAENILKEHYGEILYHDGKQMEIRIVYGIEDLTPKLSVSCVRRSLETGKPSIFEIMNNLKVFSIRGFTPLLSFALSKDKRVSKKLLISAIENAKRGVYSFVRPNGNTFRMLLVANGNLVQKKGLFYCPDIRKLQNRIPLVEIEEETERFYEENFKLLA